MRCLRYYLVDLENLPNCLFEVEKGIFKNSDNIVVFYRKSLHCRVLKDSHILLEECCKHVRYVEITSTTKNALDFNLVAFLGNIIGNFKGKLLELIIVRKDSGYRAIADYIRNVRDSVNFAIKLFFKENLYSLSTKGNMVCLADVFSDCYIDSSLYRCIEKEIKRFNGSIPTKVIMKALVGECLSRGGVHNILVHRFKAEGAELYKWMKSRYVCVNNT